MSWIKYSDALKRNVTGRPDMGEQIGFEHGSRNKKKFIIGKIISKVSSSKYKVKYTIPDEFRKYFSKDTNTAIVNINNMFWWSPMEDKKDV